MGAIISTWITVEKLEIMLDTVKKKKEKGIGLDVSINDQTDQYGNNASISVSQTKEQRERKDKKYYVGNGKVVYVKGEVSLAVKQEKKQEPAKQPEYTDTDDLPF